MRHAALTVLSRLPEGEPKLHELIKPIARVVETDEDEGLREAARLALASADPSHPLLSSSPVLRGFRGAAGGGQPPGAARQLSHPTHHPAALALPPGHHAALGVSPPGDGLSVEVRSASPSP